MVRGGGKWLEELFWRVLTGFDGFWRVLTGSDGFWRVLTGLIPPLSYAERSGKKHFKLKITVWTVVVGRWGCAPEIRWMKMFFFVLRDENFFEQIFAQNWSWNSGLGRLWNESSASLNYSGNKVVDIPSVFRTCLCKGHCAKAKIMDLGGFYFRIWSNWSRRIPVTLHRWVLRANNALSKKASRGLPRLRIISLLKQLNWNPFVVSNFFASTRSSFS